MRKYNGPDVLVCTHATMAVDRNEPFNPPVPFCLSHAEYVRAWWFCHTAFIHRLPRLTEEQSLRAEPVYDVITAIAVDTQQLLYRDDAARIRQLFVQMSQPMPAGLVTLLAALAPY